MIKPEELRLGSLVMHKVQHRIVKVACTFEHFNLLARGELAQFFPILLKAEVLEQCGFLENKSYPLAPQAREFKLELPVPGSQQVMIAAYIKANGECFARGIANNLPISDNIYHLHQLQNLYYSLTGKELEIKR